MKDMSSKIINKLTHSQKLPKRRSSRIKTKAKSIDNITIQVAAKGDNMGDKSMGRKSKLCKGEILGASPPVSDVRRRHLVMVTHHICIV